MTAMQTAQFQAAQSQSTQSQTIQPQTNAFQFLRLTAALLLTLDQRNWYIMITFVTPETEAKITIGQLLSNPIV